MAVASDIEDPLIDHGNLESRMAYPDESYSYFVTESAFTSTGILTGELQAPGSVHETFLFPPTQWNIAFPLKMLLCLILLPFIGLSFSAFAILEKRAGRLIGLNSNDWIIILYIGVTFQVAEGFVVWSILAPDYAESEGIGWVVMLFYYSVCASYMLFSAVIFAAYHHWWIRDSARVKTNEIATRKDALRRVEDLRQSTEVNSLLMLVFATGAALIETALFRMCIFTHSKCWNQGPPESDRYDLVVSTFWFLLLSSMNNSALYGWMVYYQQMRQVEEFTFFQRTDKSAKRGLLRDLNDFSSDVEVWSTIYQLMLQTVRNRPIIQAFYHPTTLCLVIMFITSLSYVAMRNVWQGERIAEFTIGCVILMIFSVSMLSAFVYVTIRLQRARDYQCSSISEAQMDLQRQLDDHLDEITQDAVLQMQSKIRVLQSLDVYLHVVDANPKLMFMTLESLRWATMLFGLFCVNLFFLMLYLQKKRIPPNCTPAPT